VPFFQQRLLSSGRLAVSRSPSGRCDPCRFYRQRRHVTRIYAPKKASTLLGEWQSYRFVLLASFESNVRPAM
jgi:hypothetical protein